jgi:hypothetical protein
MVLPSSRRLFCVAAALAATACLAPTLPLPPPGEPSISSNEQGLVHLTGHVRAEAWVFALNRASNAGTFQGAGGDGSYDLALPAQVGDSIVLWYEFDGDVSESLTIVVPAPKP